MPENKEQTIYHLQKAFPHFNESEIKVVFFFADGIDAEKKARNKEKT